LNPSKQAFNLPSPPIAPKFSSIFGARLFSILLVWCNQLNATLFQKPLIKWIFIVALSPISLSEECSLKQLSIVSSTSFTSLGEALSHERRQENQKRLRLP
jgi:hypothetical protein